MHDQQLWRLSGLLVMLLLVFAGRAIRRTNSLMLVTLWNLSGVILHETCHLVAGAALGGRPTSFSLRPRRDASGRRWILGSVTLRNTTIWNACPTALAPLLLLGIALFAESFWQTEDFGTMLVKYGLVYLLAYNSLPSRADIRASFFHGSIAVWSCIGGALVLVCLVGS